MLALAGREADIVGLNPAVRSGRVDAEAARDGAAEATDRKRGWVGRRPATATATSS